MKFPQRASLFSSNDDLKEKHGMQNLDESKWQWAKLANGISVFWDSYLQSLTVALLWPYGSYRDNTASFVCCGQLICISAPYPAKLATFPLPIKIDTRQQGQILIQNLFIVSKLKLSSRVLS